MYVARRPWSPNLTSHLFHLAFNFWPIHFCTRGVLIEILLPFYTVIDAIKIFDNDNKAIKRSFSLRMFCSLIIIKILMLLTAGGFGHPI